ncbi:MAG: hypothetical protein LKM44_00560 [Wolbachia endosymbiont of Meromenopon meropis]|nr:hypothetical protein [Wolbachia endosymbiont of Meromenopon meropis]
MKTSEKKFKGFDYYRLCQDKDGKLKLTNYHDILNARRARIDLLLDNAKESDINLLKLNQSLSEKFVNDEELLLEFYNEDQRIVQEELKILNILDNIDDLRNIKSEDLLEISLILSDLSFIERNIVLNTDQNFDLVQFKYLFIEKKRSGEKYSNEEYKNFLNNVDKINAIIKMELKNRIEEPNSDKKNSYNDLQEEIVRGIEMTKKKKNY